MDDQTSTITSPTGVGFQDDPKPVVKKKSRFPLFRLSRSRPRSSATKQNKISDNVDSPNGDSAPNSPALYTPTTHGTLRKYASANNIQDLAKMTVMSPMSPMSPSLSNDNLEEVEGSMSQSASPYNNICDRPTARHKHSVSTGNIPQLMSKGMSYSKSTSNLQDLNGGMRRYASALNLLDLDINEEVDAEEEGDDHVLENCAGDVSIDDKADQFIAQFYQQMKSQHKVKRRHDNTNND